MAESETYTVSVHDGRGWRTQARLHDRERALDMAESLHAGRRHLQVRVERGARILLIRRHRRLDPGAWALLPVAVAGGILAYFATRWALTSFALL